MANRLAAKSAVSTVESAMVRSRSSSTGRNGAACRAFVPGQRADADERERRERDAPRRAPREAMADRGEPEQRTQRGDGEKHLPGEVARRRGRRMSLARGQAREAPGGECGERQVGEEQPAPAPVRHHQAADHRPADARAGEDQREVALEADALARRHQLADQRLRQRHQPAAAQPLQHARRDQLRQLCAAPHAAEPSVNTPSATSSILRRPWKSPSRP